MAGQSVDDRNRDFVSYRRDDARGASERLYDWLRIAFGWEYVFRDVGSIGIGPGARRSTVPWREEPCASRSSARDGDKENLSRRRDKRDMVCRELVTALATPNPEMVPTLVEGAEMPSATKLPKPLVCEGNQLNRTALAAPFFSRLAVVQGRD